MERHRGYVQKRGMRTERMFRNANPARAYPSSGSQVARSLGRKIDAEGEKERQGVLDLPKKRSSVNYAFLLQLKVKQ